MIVAVAIVRMVEMSIYQKINVIPVRHGFMAALRAMHVLLLMSAAGMLRRADHRVAGIHCETMLINVVAMRRVEMPVM